MATTSKVILAEDNASMSACVRDMIAACPAFMLVGEAADGVELLELLAAAPKAPDLALIDLSMPRLGGIEAIREIRKSNPEIKLLVLTMHKGEEYVCRAFTGGADGYLLKDNLGTELFTALTAVLAGETYVSPGAAADLENAWLKLFIARRGSVPFKELSLFESDVLGLLAKGESSPCIARALRVEPRDVDRCRESIARKLQLGETAGAGK